MRSSGAGLEAFPIRADVGTGQIQHLAPKLPVFRDLLFRLRGATCQFAVLLAGRDNGAYSLLETRIIELQRHAGSFDSVRIGAYDCRQGGPGQ